MCSFSGRKQIQTSQNAHYHTEKDVWNGREAIKKALLKPPVKQTEMKQVSNSTIPADPREVDSKLELNKVLNKIQFLD